MLSTFNIILIQKIAFFALGCGAISKLNNLGSGIKSVECTDLTCSQISDVVSTCPHHVCKRLPSELYSASTEMISNHYFKFSISVVIEWFIIYWSLNHLEVQTVISRSVFTYMYRNTYPRQCSDRLVKQHDDKACLFVKNANMKNVNSYILKCVVWTDYLLLNHLSTDFDMNSFVILERFDLGFILGRWFWCWFYIPLKIIVPNTDYHLQLQLN